VGERCIVPRGNVKWFDSEKGFGFIGSDEGEDVFVHASALPPGVEELKPGTIVDFGIIEGRRGQQAMSVEIHEIPASVAKASRKSAADMAPIVEDLIKVLDGLSNQLRKGRYPPDAAGRRMASLLRAVADDLDV